MRHALFGLLLTPILLAGCATAPKGAPSTAPPATSAPQKTEGIQNKYWKLVTLEGQPVKMAPDQEREAFFTLRDSSRVTGFGGCNVINGSYELNEGQMRLRFVNLLSTMRACPGPDNERGFLAVLNQADNFNMRGDTLLLNVGRRAPLAVFHAVYF